MMLMDDDSVRSESLECTDVTVPTIISGAINEPVSHFGQTHEMVKTAEKILLKQL